MPNQQKRGSSDDSRPPNEHPRPDKTDNDSDHPGTQSLATRIQNSASGLAKNAFLSSAISGDTAHLLSDGSKTTPSSSSALTAAEQYRESTGPSSSRNLSDHSSADTFRSPYTAQSGGFELSALTEDEFQNSYGDDLLDTTANTGKGKGKGKDRVADGNPDKTTLLPSDGDAVVSILSDRTFDPEFPPSVNEPPECVDTELIPPQLTPAEIEMIELFRRQLPPDTHPQQSPDQPRQLNSFSLIPDISSVLDTHPASDPNTSFAISLRDTVFTSLPGSAEWIAVEEKYHDEVWGYLQPTLEAAAKEIESKKASSVSEDGPAVRRLKMILKHMHH
ncbi:hypothetical protein BJX99DRAFT_223311 [Aspergillus californicus]